jgi:uncharacterized BrkB/YihY/UPF0761 family membrane protein
MVKPVFKISLVIFSILVLCIPFTFIVNFLMNPFWLWVENTFGIEASGHSGPSDWTFEVVYFLFIIIFIPGYWFLYKNKTKKQI